VIFESGFNPNTITTTGAMGLMAIQPETAIVLNVKDPFDPRDNVDGGARLLQRLSSEFGANVQWVLAAYNAGPKSVRRYGGVPKYRETQDYVRQVGAIHALCRAQPETFLSTGSASS
jgi:soluble lytic murein transglycosylase-like protein